MAIGLNRRDPQNGPALGARAKVFALACLAALISVGASAPERPTQLFVTSMTTLRSGHPELDAMWRDAEKSKVILEKTAGVTRFRLTSAGESKPPKESPQSKGRWLSTAKPLTLGVVDNRPGSFELASGDHPVIRIHRLHSERARAKVDGGTVTVTDAAAGMDAVFFARASSSIEELLVVRDPSIEIGYDLELPSGWSLHQGPPRDLVEIRDERDVAQLRVRARVGWDAQGREIEVTPRANGSRISIAFPREAVAPVLVDPTWEDTGSMLSVRSGHTATLLPNGRILVAGGGGTPDAEIFDPATRAFTAAPPMALKRIGQTATMLRSGRVLLVGGGDGSAMESMSRTAETFDSKASSFQLLSSEMSFPHVDGHTATRLVDGRVLVAGATSAALGGGTGNEADVYDEPTDAFHPAPPMTASWTSGSASRLPSGEVVIVGANAGTIDAYDALADSVALAGATQHPLIGHTTTVLQDGLVFIAGGGGPFFSHATELFDSSSGQTTSSVDLTGIRVGHAATLLPSGSILVSGGGPDSAQEIALSGGVLLSQTETQMSAGRAKHTSTLLPDGRVVVLGGSMTIATGEIFEPRVGRQLAGGPISLEDDPLSTTAHDHQPVPLADGKSFIPLRVWPEGRGLILDPSTGLTQVVGAPKSDVFPFGGIVSVVMNDGRVLMIGTDEGSNLVSVRFDPSDLSFSAPHVLPTPTQSILGQSATLLSNGKVLVLGGWANALLYDPLTDAYTVTGMPVHSTSSQATLLADGRVLVTGGGLVGPNGPAGFPLADGQLYDPSTNSSSPTGPMHIPRLDHRATLLSSGKVLISGGIGGSQTSLDSAELYDPTTLTFEALTPHMMVARSHHASVLLPSGQVALAGGGDATVEVFDPDPAPGSFRAAGTLGWTAPNAEAAFLTDGKLLVVGRATDPFLGAWATWDWDDAIATSSRPVLGVVASSVAAGSTTNLTGGLFEGIGEASDGNTNASPTDYPVALWVPIRRGVPIVGTIESWTDGSAKWTVPNTSFPGSGMLFVVTNGIRSVGHLVTISPSPLGASCSANVQCTSGVCANGTCCDQPCDGVCTACTAAAKGAGPDGVCGSIQAGLPSPACPTEDVKLCGHDGLCDANAQCAYYPDGTECGPGESCTSKVCLLGNDFACDGDHVVSNKSGQQIDCAPYRCSNVTNKCFSACGSSLECVDGLVCGTSGRCEAPVASGREASCAIRTVDSSTPTRAGIGATLLFLAVSRRRSRSAPQGGRRRVTQRLT